MFIQVEYLKFIGLTHKSSLRSGRVYVDQWFVSIAMNVQPAHTSLILLLCYLSPDSYKPTKDRR
jgi:hypothetical protein